MIMKNYQVLIATREKFTQQISFRSKDKDIFLAKTLVYIAAEGEAFMVHNREMNAHSIQNERNDSNVLSDRRDWDYIEAMPMAGKKIDDWLLELDNIANEVKVEVSSRDIGCHLVEVLEAVNKVLFESTGFRSSPVRLHWKHASSMNHGLMLTSPLRRLHDESKINGSANMPLLRPQDLR
ncbi:hypothetical protein HanIR_Chr15g0743421 [Helianthus annuus]|nr:hypothetical protein HanIR_Chr15g0743421 [Helianthus annuus]